MSKNMQITVTVQPFYDNDFEGTYPKLGRALRHVDADFTNQNPSLYELTGQIDKLLYRTDGTSIREPLIRHKENLKNIYNTIQDHISKWNLSKADKLLYRIEDIFEEIESELD